MRQHFASVLMVVLVACSSPSQISESEIQTAIAETESVTSLKISPSPVFTETSSPTETSTPTLEPTPDNRVINIDPYELLLKKDLLPKDGRYYLPASDWTSPHRNSEVVSGWGVEEGRVYLAETGRVDGWWVYYLRGTIKFLGPEEVYDNVVLYKDEGGAALVMTEYSTCVNEEYDYVHLQSDFLVGDMTNVCKWQEMQPGGVNRVSYRIEFSYRNVYHALEAYGWEYEIDSTFLEYVAISLLEQLELAPLSSSVTFSP